MEAPLAKPGDCFSEWRHRWRSPVPNIFCEKKWRPVDAVRCLQIFYKKNLEAPTGIEPVYAVLQTAA